MTNAAPRVAVVLAGGLGTRVRHLLGALPKPLAPVAGRPFLEWVLRYLHGQGVQRAILSAGYGAAQISDFAAGLQLRGMQVDVAAEPEPLGTAGGFLHAWHALRPEGADVLVLNGDSLALADLAPLGAALTNAAAAMLAVQVDDASRYGSLAVDAQARLKGFAEKRAGAGAGLVNAGVYLFSRAAVDAFPPRRPLSFETDVFPALLGEGRPVQVVAAACPFLDIGTEASMAQAGRFITDNRHWFGD
ncbi:sugar phosphate nucleotidyltransferase [Ramlibacter sp. PS4R-6]|uniref:sugar phosphate nucleotidyltransferase n=1 Tax=Ramlibacter sp. PS4R-6 TaxID=3133438 RepID=UPI0030B78E2C